MADLGPASDGPVSVVPVSVGPVSVGPVSAELALSVSHIVEDLSAFFTAANSESNLSNVALKSVSLMR